MHAPPKPEAGSNVIVESRSSLHPVEQPPEYPERMATSPRPQGNLLKSAGDQAIKDGSGAVEAALSSVIGTIGFIGDGLRSAAVSVSFDACSLRTRICHCFSHPNHSFHFVRCCMLPQHVRAGTHTHLTSRSYCHTACAKCCSERIT